MARKDIFLGSRIVDKNRPGPIGNQSCKVALRPGCAGTTSNLVSGKYSFMFVCFLGPEFMCTITCTYTCECACAIMFTCTCSLRWPDMHVCMMAAPNQCAPDATAQNVGEPPPIYFTLYSACSKSQPGSVHFEGH
jgi:hypothetical protein